MTDSPRKPGTDKADAAASVPDIAEQSSELAANRPAELTDKQAQLAELLVLNGLEKPAAITAAGYTSQSAGYAALRLEKVQAYVEQLIRSHLLESAVRGIRTIHQLMANSRSDYVKLEAAQDVLDRAGFKPVEKHMHAHGGRIEVSIDLGDG